MLRPVLIHMTIKNRCKIHQRIEMDAGFDLTNSAIFSFSAKIKCVLKSFPRIIFVHSPRIPRPLQISSISKINSRELRVIYNFCSWKTCMTGRNVKLDKLVVASLRDLRQTSLPVYMYFFVFEVIVQLHMLGTCTIIFRIKVPFINPLKSILLAKSEDKTWENTGKTIDDFHSIRVFRKKRTFAA